MFLGGTPCALWSAAAYRRFRAVSRDLRINREATTPTCVTRRKLHAGVQNPMPRPNLLSLFDDFRGHSRDVAVVQRRGYRRESWTYNKLAGIAVRAAQGLKQRSIRTGDRVLLWGPNSAEWMAAFWGCLLRGAVAVPIDGGATSGFAARVARETSPKLVFASAGKPILDPAIPTLNLEDLADIPAHTRVAITHRVARQTPPSISESLADEPITRS